MIPALRIAALGLAALAASSVAAAERYYAFHFQGQRTGHIRASESTGPGGERIAIRDTELNMRRGATQVRIRLRTECRAGPDLSPRSFSLVKDDGDQVQQVLGRREGATFQVETRLGGKTSTREVLLPAGTVCASLAEERVVAAQLTVGESIAFPVFLEEANQVATATYRLRARETRDVLGRPREVLVVDSELLGLRGTEVLLADTGHLVAAALPALGTEYRWVPREEALAAHPGPDLLARARYELPPELGPLPELARLTVRLVGQDLPRPPAGRGQRLLKATAPGPAVVLELLPASPPERPDRLPLTAAPSVTRYLAATPFEQVTDARIQAAAQRARGDARDAWTAAQRLVHWVHRHIPRKTMARPYLSALEVLEGAEGDCTEHAILFSALAKASGVPTRLVNGLAYAGGVLAYHEWNEVYVGAEGWIPVDPTFDQAPADLAHLALVVGTSDDEGMLAAGLVGLRYLAGLKLEVLEAFRRDGTRVELPHR